MRLFKNFCLALVFISLTMSIVKAQPLTINAAQIFILDNETGAILYDKNSSASFTPASLTKMMTAELIFHALETNVISEDQLFVVSENAWRKGGAPSGTATMFAGLKTQIKVGDLLKGLLIDNANDAAIILAEGIAGSEKHFAHLMNQRAIKLGLKASFFVNPTGLPEDGQQTTLRDMVTLAYHIVQTYPEYYKLYSEPNFTWNKINQRNKNPLLKLDINSDGIAYGYDKNNGFSIIASALKNNKRIFVGLNGLKSDKIRVSETTKTINWVFDVFERKVVYNIGDIVGVARVYGGQTSTVSLLIKETVGIMTTKEKASNIKAQIVYKGPLIAPVQADTKVGMLQILNEKNVLIEKPVYTAHNIKQTGMVGRLKDMFYEFTIGKLISYL